jgi:hypothetical protein
MRLLKELREEVGSELTDAILATLRTPKQK